MQLFGGRFGTSPPDANFDNLGRAAVTSLQLITGVGWANIYFTGIRFGETGASNLVLIPLMILGKFFLTQMLTAVLIARLPEDPLIQRCEYQRAALRRKYEEAEAEATPIPDLEPDLEADEKLGPWKPALFLLRVGVALDDLALAPGRALLLAGFADCPRLAKSLVMHFRWWRLKVK